MHRGLARRTIPALVNLPLGIARNLSVRSVNLESPLIVSFAGAEGQRHALRGNPWFGARRPHPRAS